MSKEYIEREALIKAIANDCLELVYYTKEDAIQSVKASPAADVVEVVRCRDCKHSYRIDGAKEEYDCAKISAFAKFFSRGSFLRLWRKENRCLKST